MTARTVHDVERLVRRTLAEVGARTEIDPDPTGAGVRVVATMPPAANRRWVVSAAAAVVVGVVVTGLLVIARRGAVAPADQSELVHVLPAFVAAPRGDAPRPLALTAISSDETSDSITYASAPLTVIVRVDRHPVDSFDGDALPIRDGGTAFVTGDAQDGRLRWRAPSGATITIEWEGESSGGIADIATMLDALILVDADTWHRHTRFGGFTEPERRLGRRVLEGVEISIEGSLQTGLSYRIGGVGFAAPGRAGTCWAENLGDNETWAIVSRSPDRVARVTFADGVERTAELQRFAPGTDVGVAVVRRERADRPSEPTVTCEAAR